MRAGTRQFCAAFAGTAALPSTRCPTSSSGVSQRRGFASARSSVRASSGGGALLRGCSGAGAGAGGMMVAAAVAVVAPATQRRAHFYEKQAQDDPWFDRVRAQDIYGIIAVTDDRVAADVAAAAAAADSSSTSLPLATAESLFSGLAALSTTLQMDVVPARLTGVAAVKEGVEGVSLQPLVFARERPEEDSDRFEPLDVARLRAEVRRIAHAAGWLPDGPASSPKGCRDLADPAARDALGLPAFLATRTDGLNEVDARVRVRQVEVALDGVPEALGDVEALIGMLLAEDDFVVKSD